MTIGRSAKATSRRGTRTSTVSEAPLANGQPPATSEVVVESTLESISEEESMSQVIDPGVEPETPASKRKAKAGAIQLSQQPGLAVWQLPVMSSDLEIAGTILDGGVRPIAASHLDVYGTILNNRPVMSSHLKIFEMLPGDRPVFYSDIHMVESEELPGHRPVMVSDPALLNASTLPGNRPIASNNIDDAPTLMGFID
jgi:hypothetical protein